MRIFSMFLVLLTMFACTVSGNQSAQKNDYPPVNDPTTLPVDPSNITTTANSFCSVLVRWNDNSDNESGFIIERSLENGFSAFKEIITKSNATAYLDSSEINAGTQYFYRVKARNSFGDSGYTHISSVSTPAKPAASPKIANHLIIDRLRTGGIPLTAIQTARSGLRVGYGHTSHGNQLIQGMDGLISFANGNGLNGAYNSVQNLFTYNADGSDGALCLNEGLGGDCGYYPDWVDSTRSFLRDNPSINVIIWSWCGQAAYYSEEDMNNNYLNPMNQLEKDFPDIKFVYMTCHLDGSGQTGNLNQRNEQIRNYCIANDRWLFDFADIESYDPDGEVNYMELSGTDGCNYDFNGNGQTEQEGDPALPINGDRSWAIDWQNNHTSGTDWYDCEADHSQSLNTNMKAYAAWWLWCRLAGWDGN